MQELTYLRIYSRQRAQAHKWEVTSGLVTYGGDRMLPREAYRMFLVDYPMFSVVRADVIRRILDDTQPRGYRWEDLERFDR